MSKNYKDIKGNFGSHFVFSTLPVKNDKLSPDFEKNIEDYYFNQYRKDLFSEQEANENKHLFKPLKFYMLGDYDICYISLINSFNFVHRLFEPVVEEDTPFNAHTFQSYSGFLLHQEKNLNKIKDLFINGRENPISNFIGVINLKLNNGLYIGNGLSYIESIYKFIDETLQNISSKKINFLLNQTFSWFELSLVVFINNPTELSEVLIKLRHANLESFKDDTIINSLISNCLYNSYGFNIENIKSASLFSDTSSHFGFNELLIEKSFNPISDRYDDKVEKFILEAQNITLETEIEWQVKPGHINELINYLQNSKHEFCDYFNELKEDNFKKNRNSETNLVLGKCDYLITENKDSILSNFHLIRHLHETRTENCDIYKYVRKIRTYIFLNADIKNYECKIETNNNENQIDWSKVLTRLAVKPKEFVKYEKTLRKLKLSRQIRNKILKIFSNYNNGVLDPIQFIYFTDFTVFINRLKAYLDDQEKDFDNHVIKRIYDIEYDLVQFIQTFEEAYNVRFLNGYQFENIPDIDLDFNNSIQQLLSAYGLIIHDFGNILFKREHHFGPVVQLNNLDTVSNLLSINFAAHLLTSPEFIATTLSKEILNIVALTDTNEKITYLRKNSNRVINDLISEINEAYLDDLHQSELINFNYFLIDSVRMIITFGGDFELFKYWFWAYNFQNTSLYDTSGMINEQYLRQEMFRLLLVQKFFKLNVDYFEKELNIGLDIALLNDIVECPTPEIHTYWIAHYEKLNKIANRIFIENKKEDPYMKIIKEVIVEISSKYISSKSNSSNNKVLEINDILKNHIESIKIKNKSSIPTLVKRNWDDGSVIKEYEAYNNKYLTLMDQTGGSYQQFNRNRQEYFNYTSNMLLKIIDFSAVNKNKFIKNLNVTSHE